MKIPPLFSLVLAALCSTASIAAGADPANPRPNILFIFADDWGRYAGAYAALDAKPGLNHIVKTPNIDRVAREGVLFRNAFVNAPSCTPCRSALLSGRYFFNTGRAAILSGAVWDPAIPSFPLMLRDAGYHIGETYKVWSPGTPNDAPFGAGKYRYETAGALPNNYSETMTRLVGSGESPAAAREKILGQVQSNFDSFLAARPEGQPWHYFFGPTTTHRKWVKSSGRELWGIDPATLEGRMPPYLPDVPEVREDVADYLGEVQALDSYVGVLLRRLEETGELDRTLIVISGDHGMPGVPGGKCNLYDFGTNVALLARMPVPAGKPAIPGGRVVDDFVTLMDLAPTFLEAAGIQPPPAMNARSLWPVLTSGNSGQVDPARTSAITGRERHVDSARPEGKPYPMRALRTAQFLYIRNFAPDRWPNGEPGFVTETEAPPASALEENTYSAFPDMDASPTKAWLIMHRTEPKWKSLYDFAFGKRPPDELYDLSTDPGQTRNVATDPAYAGQKTTLASDLLARLREVGDPRVLSDTPPFESAPFTDVVKKRDR